MKQCSKCKEIKSFEAFYKHNASKDGYRWQCISCHQSYRQSPEYCAKANSKWYVKRKLTNPALFMWKQAKHRAKFDYNNMEFSIVPEDIILPECCPYFKVPFQPLHRQWGYSLDRIDSTKGYTKDNIQVISRKANIMKNDASLQELVTFAKGVLECHQKEVSHVCVG